MAILKADAAYKRRAYVFLTVVIVVVTLPH